MTPRTSTPAGSSPVSSSASRRAASIGGFAGVDAAARKRDLAGMVIQGLRALQQQDIQIGRGQQLDRRRGDVIQGAEEHQHGGPADPFAGLDGEFPPARVRRRRGAGLHRGNQVNQVLACGHCGLLCDSIRISAARCVSASSLASSSSCPGASSYFSSFAAFSGSVSPVP